MVWPSTKMINTASVLFPFPLPFPFQYQFCQPKQSIASLSFMELKDWSEDCVQGCALIIGYSWPSMEPRSLCSCDKWIKLLQHKNEHSGQLATPCHNVSYHLPLGLFTCTYNKNILYCTQYNIQLEDHVDMYSAKTQAANLASSNVQYLLWLDKKRQNKGS